eukprot:7005408-Prymnesium_polylepis.1
MVSSTARLRRRNALFRPRMIRVGACLAGSPELLTARVAAAGMGPIHGKRVGGGRARVKLCHAPRLRCEFG